MKQLHIIHISRVFPLLVAFALLLSLLSGCGSDRTAGLLPPTATADPDSPYYITVRTPKGEYEIGGTESEVPVTQVLAACGIRLNWSDDNTVSFKVNGASYTLSVSDLSLKKEGEDANLITPPTGATDPVSFVRDREIYLDPNTMNAVLFRLGFQGDRQTSVVINVKEGYVSPDEETEATGPRQLLVQPVNSRKEPVVLELNIEEIPLTRVLEACGVKLNWSDEDHATFTVNEKTFALCISENKITDSADPDTNLIYAAYFVDNPIITSQENEIFMDIETTNLVLHNLGLRDDDQDTVVWLEP